MTFANEDMVCIGCQKRPDELLEYIDAAAAEPEYYDNAYDYVRREEGTLNYRNGHFLCTECYVDWGMPSHESGWVAP